VIGPSQRPLPYNTEHSQETDIHAFGGIPTRSPGKRAATGIVTYIYKVHINIHTQIYVGHAYTKTRIPTRRYIYIYIYIIYICTWLLHKYIHVMDVLTSDSVNCGLMGKNRIQFPRTERAGSMTVKTNSLLYPF
jgi:hypothetical protein